jgi:hypothetical protein
MSQTIPPSEVSAVQAVIRQQLAAFKKDNAPAAFALASPSVRAQFESPARFIQMVRSQYPTVYRPTRFDFGEPLTFQDQPAQQVLFQDAAGALHLGIYPMEKQPDGSWRINGCFMVPLAGD